MRRGFTLIELLVVVGIVSVLIGILLPTLARARESAQTTRCVSNLRQLYLAQTLYANDHKGRMAPIVYPGMPSPYTDGATSWKQPLARMLGTDAVFECPSRPEGEDVNTYGINSCIMMPQWDLRISRRTDTREVQVDYQLGRKKAAVQPFSEIILFADKGTSSDDMLRTSDGYSFLNEENDYGVSDLWEQWMRHSPLSTLRHRTSAGRSANAVFMDGHVGPINDELRLHSGHWYFGEQPAAIKVIGGMCCQ